MLQQSVLWKWAAENEKIRLQAEYEAALQWLNDAGMIHQVYRVAPPRLPLDSYQDFAAFKLYMHDVGLLGALSGLRSSVLINGNELFTNFKGSMTEQYVLQELTAREEREAAISK